MGSKDTAENVEFVDHHMIEAAEERRPSSVAWEDPSMKHLWIREDHVGGRTNPASLLRGRISVVGTRHDLGEAVGVERTKLILGQGLRRKDQQRGTGVARSCSRLSDRDLITAGLSRRRAGRDDNRMTGVHEIDCFGLVRPEPVAAERSQDSGAYGCDRIGVPGRSSALMLDVGKTSVGAQHVDEVVEFVEIIDRGRSQVRHLDDRHAQVSHRRVTEQRQIRVGPLSTISPGTHQLVWRRTWQFAIDQPISSRKRFGCEGVRPTTLAVMQVLRRSASSDDVMVISVIGDLDLSGVPALRSASIELAADGWNRVVLDLGAVEFIDSAGIGVLIGLRRRCIAADGECVLAEMTTQVEQLLRSAEVDQLFVVSSTVDDAKSLIAQSPWAT